MRFTGKLLVMASFMAASFVTVQMNNKAQAVDPPNALNKPIHQFRAQSSGFYNDYNHRANNYNYQAAPNYNYQQAPVQQRSYSANPEATSDIPAPPGMNYAQSDCAAAPDMGQQQRSYSYEPQSGPAQQRGTYRSYRSYRSVPSYQLPRAMRHN